VSATKNDKATEDLIKSTAKRLFFGEGKFNATTQEIADEVGINRTLIHYYFRSRENLFNIVFEEIWLNEDRKSKDILCSDLSFKEKCEKYIDYSINLALKYPYLYTYLNTHYGKNAKNMEEREEIFSQFFAQYEQEIQNKHIADIKPIQFLLNLTSLVSLPIMMRPMFQEILNLNNKEYEKILKERKQIIMGMIFKAPYPPNRRFADSIENNRNE
jgi:AcrR family transcriptional regulator